MTQLYFPNQKDDAIQQPVCLSEKEYQYFSQVCDDLDKLGSRLAAKCMENSASVTRQQVTVLAKSTYSLTVELFDAKKARGESLLAGEQAIYNLCKQEIAKNADPNVDGSFLGSIFNAIELVRNCIEQVKDWFGFSTEEDKANLVLVKAGNTILPNYGSMVRGFFTTIAELFLPVFAPTVLGVAEAQAECALHYQETRTVNKKTASTMLNIADYAYGRLYNPGIDGYVKLSSNELPAELRVLYSESTGLLKSSRGLQVWLGKKDDHIAVSYSGTDVKSFDMLYADVIQLSAPSVLYLKAAGLLKMLLDYHSNKKFDVTGHSLGGGLTQFSTTANMNAAANRIQGYGYNPAGLSKISLEHLESSRLNVAKKRIFIFMTCYDPVSAVGGKLGCLVTLPKTEHNGHFMDDLKECMKKYTEEPAPAPSADISIHCYNHRYTPDFIPYTCKLSLSDSTGKTYPVFNDDAASSKSECVTISISRNLFNALRIPAAPADSCMGVYNKFNGTAHTVLNRLLLLSENGPVITTASTGNIHSSIIYGKFGLGMKEFIPVLQKAYADSGENISGSRSRYERVLSMLNDPLAYDKAAWCSGIQLEFGINMNTVFSRWPLAEAYFDQFLLQVTSDRTDIYRSLYKQGTPDKSTIKSFLSQFTASVTKHGGVLMDKAIQYYVITRHDKDIYLQKIQSFSNRVISGV